MKVVLRANGKIIEVDDFTRCRSLYADCSSYQYSCRQSVVSDIGYKSLSARYVTFGALSYIQGKYTALDYCALVRKHDAVFAGKDGIVLLDDCGQYDTSFEAAVMVSMHMARENVGSLIALHGIDAYIISKVFVSFSKTEDLRYGWVSQPYAEYISAVGDAIYRFVVTEKPAVVHSDGISRAVERFCVIAEPLCWA